MVKQHSTYRKKSYSKKNTKKQNRKVYKVGTRIHNVYSNRISPHIYENTPDPVFGTSRAKTPQEWLQKNCDVKLNKKEVKKQQLLLNEYESIHKKILSFIEKHDCYFFNDIKRFNVFNDAIQYFPDDTFTRHKKQIVRRSLFKQTTNDDRFKYNNSKNKYNNNNNTVLLSANGKEYPPKTSFL
jgi:hypothetical protein